eukprot:3342551-Amphidinium_carterae.2
MDSPSGNWVAPTRRSPQQPMAILRQSKYLSTGESWRQKWPPALLGAVKGSKSATMTSCGNQHWPERQQSRSVRLSWALS